MGEIAEKVHRMLKGRARVTSYQSNRASEIGHPCLRYLVFSRTRWQEAQLPSLKKLLLFEEGQKQELQVLRDLQDAGIRVVQQQRPLYNEELNLIGHVDGMIEVGGELLPLEIKAVNPVSFDRIACFADLETSRHHWERNWAFQLQAYILLSGKPGAVLLLKNKLTGELKDLLLKREEKMLLAIEEKCHLINGYVRDEFVPDVPDHLEERICQDCRFNHICARDLERGASTVYWEEEEVIELLEERAKLRPLRDRYEEVDRRLKEIFEGVALAVCGDWVITGKWIDRKGYKVAPGRYWRMKILKTKEEA